MKTLLFFTLFVMTSCFSRISIEDGCNAPQNRNKDSEQVIPADEPAVIDSEKTIENQNVVSEEKA